MHWQQEVVFANVVAVLFTQSNGELEERSQIAGQYSAITATMRTQSDAQPRKPLWFRQDWALLTNFFTDTRSARSSNSPTPSVKSILTATPTAMPLAHYVGWGTVSNVFNPYQNYGAYEKWKKANARFKALLTREQMTAAEAKVPNAHYTSPQIARFSWAS